MKTIPLTQGKFAMVDDEDFEVLSQNRWYATCFKGKFYAYINDGLLRRIGTFKTLLEASRAYDAESIKSFGEFAKVNGH